MTEDLRLGTYHEIYSDDPEYRAEGMANDVVHQLTQRMQRSGLSRSELADVLGVNRAYISKILNAPPNLTLRSIAAVTIALGIKTEPKVILDPGDWIVFEKGAHQLSLDINLDDGYTVRASVAMLASGDEPTGNTVSSVIPFVRRSYDRTEDYALDLAGGGG